MRNAGSTVGRQLEALARQECEIEWELVVVNNGSTDGTLAIVTDALPRLANARIADGSTKVGLAYARNVGCRGARGEVLLFCDADDEVDRHWVATMTQAVDDADFVGGTLHREQLNRREWLGDRGAASEDLIAWTGFLPYPSGASSGVRASVFRALGGFDESYVGGAEDTNFFWRAHLAGYVGCFAPAAIVHYRERSTLRSVAKQFYGYGAQHPHLYRDFRDQGMPSSRWRSGLKFWARLVIDAPRAWSSPAGRRQWVRWAARGVGRISGSVRYRTLYL